MKLVLLFTLSALQSACIHGSCTVGREWPATNENPDAGTYIDLTNTAPCSGLISHFHFCSLNASLYNDPGSTVTVGLHVWRFDANFINGSLVREYIATSAPAATGIQCMTIDVQSEAIEIAEGDVLGVRMFQRLPLVGNRDPVFAPVILRLQPQEFSTSINRPGLPDPNGAIISGNNIFLRADVVPVSTTTEERPDTTMYTTTSSTSTSRDFTIPISTERNTTATTENRTPTETQTLCISEVLPGVNTTREGLDYRIIVGVVVVANLQLAIIVLIIVVAMVLGKKRQREKLMHRTISTKVSEDTSDEMVPNEMYGLTNSMARRHSEDNMTEDDLHYSTLVPRSDVHTNEGSESFSMHVNVVYPPSLPKTSDHSYDYIST